MRLFTSLYAGCFGRDADVEGGNTPLSVNSSIDAQRISSPCVFCDVSRAKGFNIVWEDECFTVFADRNPAAAHHLLVIPKIHIGKRGSSSVQSYSKTVDRMAEIGHHVLDDLKVPASSRRLGFHIPPFFSVNHLHMHAQGLPYRSTARALKYHVSSGSRGHDKGFSWFCEAKQAIHILENGGRIRILPC
ncbi:hypothetical protein DAEQUDRAFT_661907 [Daedalea quercina L-15889]|uniref:HIT domain-containing protein n=1 Tax=Daedalea quercina L-15889 TaxID=1314783 RepID=A0A165TKB6_9APHY|nr:hypothetical protein DAEQUDRAFT_661907 [Daedalea quercina L-15889]